MPSLQVQYFISNLGEFWGSSHLRDRVVSDEQSAVSDFPSRCIHCHQGVDIFNQESCHTKLPNMIVEK